MDVQTTTEQAPAPSPVQQSVINDDFAAFERSRNAEDLGREPEKVEPAKPVETTSTQEPPAAQPETQQPERQLSKKQQEINDRIREATERARSEDRAQIQRLEAELARFREPQRQPQAQSPRQPVTNPDPEPDSSDATKYPDGQYDAQYIKDVGRWAARQEHAALRAQEHRARAESAAHQELTTLGQQFGARIKEAVAKEKGSDATPDDVKAALDGIVPALREAMPFSLLSPEEKRTATVFNAIADQVFRSEQPLQILRHLTAHPELLAQWQTLRPLDLIRAVGRLEAHLDTPVVPTPKPMTPLPQPPTTLGSRADAGPVDPIVSAVGRDDYLAYEREADRRDREALARR